MPFCRLAAAAAAAATELNGFVFSLLLKRSAENGSERRDPVECKWLLLVLAAFDIGNGSSQAPEFNFGSSANKQNDYKLINTFLINN